MSSGIVEEIHRLFSRNYSVIRMNSYDFDTYRLEDIEKNTKSMGIYPLDVMVTGSTGAGKSTTLNSFFGRSVAEVGGGSDPETMDVTSYKLNEHFRIWDTPGLGDGVSRDEIHKKKLLDLLFKTYTTSDGNYGFIDMVLVIVEGGSRDLGTDFALLNEVIVPNIQKDRILVAINQADMSMKGRHWNSAANTPDEELVKRLDEQALSVQKRVREYTGVNIIKPVCYSAEYMWNVTALLDLIIDHMPSHKRELSLR